MSLTSPMARITPKTGHRRPTVVKGPVWSTTLTAPGTAWAISYEEVLSQVTMENLVALSVLEQ